MLLCKNVAVRKPKEKMCFSPFHLEWFRSLSGKNAVAEYTTSRTKQCHTTENDVSFITVNNVNAVNLSWNPNPIQYDILSARFIFQLAAIYVSFIQRSKSDRESLM